MVDLAGDVLGGEPSSRVHPPFHATRNKPKAIQYLRLPYFKLAGVGVILVLILYHIILHATWGNDSCHWLFNFGSFRDFKVWQPWGCMMHVHTSADARMCMRYKHSRNRHNNFVFVGDSRMRQIYRHFTNSLQTNPSNINWTAETLRTADTALLHHNLSYADENHGLNVQFLWTPHLNKTVEWQLRNLLLYLDSNPETSSKEIHNETVYNEKLLIPNILIVGMATWTIKQSNASDAALIEYQKNLTRVIPLFLQLAERHVTIVWVFQPPVYAARLHPARRMLTNGLIDLYNYHAEQILNKYDPNKRIRRCWSLYTIHKGVAKEESADGLHLGQTTLDYATQLFLNYYCNGDMNYSEATCCTSADQIYPVQLATFVLFGLFALASIVIIAARQSCRTTSYCSVATAENSVVDAVELTHISRAAPVFTENVYAVAETIPKQSMKGSRMYKKKHKTSDVGGASVFELQQLNTCDHDMSPADAVFADAVRPATTSNAEAHENSENLAVSPSIKSQKRPQLGFRDFCLGMTRIGLVMTYIFVCDRTNFFMKENKYFSYLQFGIPLAYLFVLGLFFNQDSNHVSVLNRDLTDEWKGWMQVVILIYHFTGASRLMPIYMCIRVMVSSYLFLSGYGHFSHFWLNGDYSLYRFVSVLFRLNFLVFILCLVMHRYYQFYYFVPLVSFWFCVLYFVMAVPPQVSAASAAANSIRYLYLILKLAAMTGAISVLSMSQVFFDTIFGMKPWRALFVLNSMKNYNIDVSVEEFGYERYSVTEWFFRWHLDRFSMLAGVLLAFCYQIIAKKQSNSFSSSSILRDSEAHGSLFGTKNVAITYFACFGAVLGLGVYGAFAAMCPSKTECNEVHSYFTFIPILAYVLLRNVWGPWRARFSSVFAWLGRISLELFVCQYHIWLAADTHGVFVLIPNSPVLNVTVTGLIFVLVSHEMHEMTKVMHRFFVPRETVPLLRNVLVFLIAMTAIGLSDNMIF